MGYSFDFNTSEFAYTSGEDILFDDEPKRKKKRGIYFGLRQEKSIIAYNQKGISEKEKTEQAKIFIPAFRRLIAGILEMPKFHTLPPNLDRQELVEKTFFRLLEKIHLFSGEKISIKTGLPVRAFSYFGTIAKNFILEQKIRHEKFLFNKADVEASIDLSLLSEDNLSKMSQSIGSTYTDYETTINNTKSLILASFLKIIAKENKRDKPDAQTLNMGLVLKDLIERWDEFEINNTRDFTKLVFEKSNVMFGNSLLNPDAHKIFVTFHKFKFLEQPKKIERPVIFTNKYLLISDKEAELLTEEMIDREMEIPVLKNGKPYEINSMQEYDEICDKTANKKFKENIGWIWKDKKEETKQLPQPKKYTKKYENQQRRQGKLWKYFLANEEKIKIISAQKRQKGNTRKMLYPEYCLQNSEDSYSYDRYCRYMRQFENKSK